MCEMAQIGIVKVVIMRDFSVHISRGDEEAQNMNS